MLVNLVMRIHDVIVNHRLNRLRKYVLETFKEIEWVGLYDHVCDSVPSLYVEIESNIECIDHINFHLVWSSYKMLKFQFLSNYFPYYLKYVKISNY